MTAKELREKRFELAKEIRRMADLANKEGRDFTSEEAPNWKKVNGDYDALSTQIDIAERAQLVDDEQKIAVISRKGTPGLEDRDAGKDENRDQDNEGDGLTDADLGLNVRNVKPEIAALAMQGWMRYQSGRDVEERHVKAAKAAGVNLRMAELTLDLATTREAKRITREFRGALSAVDLSAGASVIAPAFANTFERAMLAFGGMRQVADVIRTDTGAEMPWPTANDTGNKGHIVGENTSVAQTGITTGSVRLGAYKYTSDEVLIPVELLEDSAFDLPTTVGEICGERIGRRQNDDFTTGNAAGKPRGIVTAATTGVTTASSSAFTADEIVGLIHSVDPAYRSDPSFRLMFNDQILLAVRKLKDSQNRYLFQDAAAGAPPTIWGVPYVINQSMASTIATTNVTILAGALSKYKIRDVRQLRLRRLVERRADSDQESFIAFQRSDGNLLDAGVAPVKAMVQV